MMDLKTYINNVDQSIELNSYSRDEITVNLLAGESIVVGLYKPFSELYIEISQASGDSFSITHEYYNGSFVELDVTDHTQGLTRSGFVTWDRPSDWELSTQNSDELYWVKLTTDANLTNLVIKGVNIVYSDDYALIGEYRNIIKYLYSGDTSFITYHEAARDEIIQNLRSEGQKKQREDEAFLRNINKWDLLEIDEVREASKFLTLSKIFYEINDSIDDVFLNKARRFEVKAQNALNLYVLSLDKNDDGVVDVDERAALQFGRLSRL